METATCMQKYQLLACFGIFYKVSAAHIKHMQSIA